jgi:hypothetical protein
MSKKPSRKVIGMAQYAIPKAFEVDTVSAPLAAMLSRVPS